MLCEGYLYEGYLYEIRDVFTIQQRKWLSLGLVTGKLKSLLQEATAKITLSYRVVCFTKGYNNGEGNWYQREEETTHVSRRSTDVCI